MTMSNTVGQATAAESNYCFIAVTSSGCPTDVRNVGCLYLRKPGFIIQTPDKILLKYITFVFVTILRECVKLLFWTSDSAFMKNIKGEFFITPMFC